MAEKQQPIFSERDKDPELREAIDEFAVVLAERVDLLQDAEGDADFARAESLAEQLAADAARLGFSPLANVARSTCRACRNDKPDAVREGIQDLTMLARRVRLGHRGSL